MGEEITKCTQRIFKAFPRLWVCHIHFVVFVLQYSKCLFSLNLLPVVTYERNEETHFSDCENSKLEESTHLSCMCILLCLLLVLSVIFRLDSVVFFNANAEAQRANKERHFEVMVSDKTTIKSLICMSNVVIVSVCEVCMCQHLKAEQKFQIRAHLLQNCCNLPSHLNRTSRIRGNILQTMCVFETYKKYLLRPVCTMQLKLSSGFSREDPPDLTKFYRANAP